MFVKIINIFKAQKKKHKREREGLFPKTKSIN